MDSPALRAEAVAGDWRDKARGKVPTMEGAARWRSGREFGIAQRRLHVPNFATRVERASDLFVKKDRSRGQTPLR